MRYALIGNDGELHVKDGSYQEARAEVGPEGWAQVRLARTHGYAAWSGWVNDVGHQLPDRCPRNIIGGLVLTGMGAATKPYAGPVVLTGWNPHGMPNEVCGLDDLQADVIREIHDDARRALAGEHGLGFPGARAIAEEMRTAPTPTVTIRTINIGDFLGGRS